jgi:hypothetical protein
MKPLVAFFLLLLALGSPSVGDEELRRYLYIITPDGAQAESASGEGLLVFDIDDDFKFVRRIALGNLKGGGRGLTGCLATHSLYYSTTEQRMGRFDLETDKVLWEERYTGGCDRSSAMLDGSKIFAPTGWWERSENGGFVVIDGTSGKELSRLVVGTGAHNSIMSLKGDKLYLGTVTTLSIIDPKTEQIIKKIPEVGEVGVFPFTIDSKERYAYVCLGEHVGVDVVDLAEGKAIHRVMAGDKPIKHRTHGTALTPDESELWVSDQDGKKLYIFDATKMPPTQKGSVDLSMGGHGWVNFSLDGKYAWCHTPDIFDARSRKLVATLKDENGKPVGSSKLIEVHMKSGKVVWIGSEFGVGRAGGKE